MGEYMLEIWHEHGTKIRLFPNLIQLQRVISALQNESVHSTCQHMHHCIEPSPDRNVLAIPLMINSTTFL